MSKQSQADGLISVNSDYVVVKLSDLRLVRRSLELSCRSKDGLESRRHAVAALVVLRQFLPIGLDSLLNAARAQAEGGK